MAQQTETFTVAKYLGTWYELGHYPSWFQKNDQYNTTANYSLIDANTIKVVNSTIVNSQTRTSVGTAKILGPGSLRVDFPIPEIAKLAATDKQYIPEFQTSSEANYVIDKLWTNCHGEYIFSIVTNPDKSSLFILSRYPNPSLSAYNTIMQYIYEHYDASKLVLTPHFACAH